MFRATASTPLIVEVKHDPTPAFVDFILIVLIFKSILN